MVFSTTLSDENCLDLYNSLPKETITWRHFEKNPHWETRLNLGIIDDLIMVVMKVKSIIYPRD
jgi:hypothetical protein